MGTRHCDSVARELHVACAIITLWHCLTEWCHNSRFKIKPTIAQSCAGHAYTHAQVFLSFNLLRVVPPQQGPHAEVSGEQHPQFPCGVGSVVSCNNRCVKYAWQACFWKFQWDAMLQAESARFLCTTPCFLCSLYPWRYTLKCILHIHFHRTHKHKLIKTTS